MKRLFWHWVASAVALLIAVKVANIHMTAWYHALWLAPLFGMVNAVVGGITSVISWFAFPVNLLSLGCFGFVLSWVLYVVSVYLLGFAQGPLHPYLQVKSFWAAVIFAVVMAVVSGLLNIVLPGKDARRHKRERERDRERV